MPKIVSIYPKNYNCDQCGIETNNKKDYNKHLTTPKHMIRTNIEQPYPITDFICKTCSKPYKARNSLWYHEQKCVKDKKNNNDNIIIDISNNDISNNDISNNDMKMLTNLVLEVIKSNTDLQKQNQDLQKQMIDVCKNIQPTINNTNSHNTNSHNTNSHNKTFNLQFFLNEECKDAMNLKDFVESFQLQLTDLEKIGDVGYIEGVSNLIIDKLNDTDIHKRPVHCSDAKRETLYVKDDNVWTKEGAENIKIRGAVKNIEKKNIKLLNVWKETHAGCMNSESPYNDQYTHMIIGSLGGCEPDNVNKVIKKIAKATVIDK